MTFKTTLARGFAAAATLAVIASIAPGVASAANRQVTVINRTNHTLTRLYAAGTHFDTYRDWLGDYVLRPNQQMTIDFDDSSGACNMAVVAHFNDGDDVTMNSFDVCERSEMEFTGN